jgi:hypothetical protein
VRLLVEALERSPSIRVVTNLPLRLPELNDYLNRRGRAVNPVPRITLLSDDQVREFWRYRGHKLGSLGEPLGEVVGEVRGEVTHYPSDCLWPVVYILDEFHLFFNAREWAKTGKPALWYASQHRHFGDTVVWVSQFHGNVDRQFRVLTQDWTVCRNWALESFKGFGLPKRFRLEISLEPPDSANRVVTETRMFRPDAELFACYDTTAGVGLPGGLNPEPPPRRRPPLVLGLLLGLAVIIAAALLVPRLLGAVMSRAAVGLVQGASGVLPVASSGRGGESREERTLDAKAAAGSGGANGGAGFVTAPATVSSQEVARVLMPDGRVFRAWRMSDGSSVSRLTTTDGVVREWRFPGQLSEPDTIAKRLDNYQEIRQPKGPVAWTR